MLSLTLSHISVLHLPACLAEIAGLKLADDDSHDDDDADGPDVFDGDGDVDGSIWQICTMMTMR